MAWLKTVDGLGFDVVSIKVLELLIHLPSEAIISHCR